MWGSLAHNFLIKGTNCSLSLSLLYIHTHTDPHTQYYSQRGRCREKSCQSLSNCTLLYCLAKVSGFKCLPVPDKQGWLIGPALNELPQVQLQKQGKQDCFIKLWQEIFLENNDRTTQDWERIILEIMFWKWINWNSNNTGGKWYFKILNHKWCICFSFYFCPFFGNSTPLC